MRTVAPRLAAGSIAAVLLLSGCGGSPEPSPLPKPTDTASPSASAAPVPPEMPAAAATKTKAGVIAFTRSFVATLNYSGTTGDTQPLRNMYISLCTRCEATADGIDETYSAGGYFRGGEWSPSRFKVYSIENDVAVVDVLVSYAEQTWVKRSGAEPVTFRRSRNNLKAFNLRWQDDQWHVSALDPTA